MNVQLELMEFVWLQNINRQPGHFKLKDVNGSITTLAECGLIYLDIHNGYFISAVGKGVLKQHSPYLCNDQDMSRSIGPKFYSFN